MKSLRIRNRREGTNPPESLIVCEINGSHTCSSCIANNVLHFNPKNGTTKCYHREKSCELIDLLNDDVSLEARCCNRCGTSQCGVVDGKCRLTEHFGFCRQTINSGFSRSSRKSKTLCKCPVDRPALARGYHWTVKKQWTEDDAEIYYRWFLGSPDPTICWPRTEAATAKLWDLLWFSDNIGELSLIHI